MVAQISGVRPEGEGKNEDNIMHNLILIRFFVVRVGACGCLLRALWLPPQGHFEHPIWMDMLQGTILTPLYYY